MDYEKGRKDIAQAFGKQVTSIVVRFNQRTGNYVWHCHILEHEDYDMMRPLKVIEKPEETEEDGVEENEVVNGVEENGVVDTVVDEIEDDEVDEVIEEIIETEAIEVELEEIFHQ